MGHILVQYLQVAQNQNLVLEQFYVSQSTSVLLPLGLHDFEKNILLQLFGLMLQL